jgi:hypothetical protein
MHYIARHPQKVVEFIKEIMYEVLGRGSFGPLLCLTPTPWSIGAKVAIFSLARNTCCLINCRPYLLHGFLHIGAVW